MDVAIQRPNTRWFASHNLGGQGQGRNVKSTDGTLAHGNFFQPFARAVLPYNKGMLRRPVLCTLLLYTSARVVSADWLDDGIKALDQQRYTEAEVIFAKAVVDEPADYAAHFHLALSRSLMGRQAEAIASYEKTLALKPGLPEAELNLGMLLAGAGQHARAQQLLRASLEKKPDAVNAKLALGRSLMETGDLSGAEPWLAQAAAADARNRDSLLELANEFEKVKNWDAARRLYTPLAGDPVVAERLGVVYIASGEAAGAVAPLEYAIAKAPSAANHYALGIALLRSKRPAEAVPHFAAAAAGEPKNLDMRLTYGRALRDQRQFAPAAQQFLAAAQLQPDSRESWSELAGMLVMMENFPQALKAYERLEALGETAPGLHFFKALCQDRLQLRPAALASYEKYLSLSSGLNPDQEFQARQRVLTLKREVKQ
jgi:tetratricopeptide (TPR) repeat protein